MPPIYDENRFVTFAMTAVSVSNVSASRVVEVKRTVQRNDADDEADRKHHDHKRIDL